jgi:hypothetical protein
LSWVTIIGWFVLRVSVGIINRLFREKAVPFKHGQTWAFIL